MMAESSMANQSEIMMLVLINHITTGTWEHGHLRSACSGGGYKSAPALKSRPM
jgi:hypothetical protein